MAGHIATGGIHHLRLTVTDVARSREFYTSLLGFDVAVESPPAGDPSAEAMYRVLFGGVVMVRGNLLMGLRPVAPQGDRFDEDRVGLDHLSFSVASRGELDEAVRLCEIATLTGFGICVLPFRDPDNIQTSRRMAATSVGGRRTTLPRIAGENERRERAYRRAYVAGGLPTIARKSRAKCAWSK